MNLSIFLRVLTALASITDREPNTGNSVTASALQLKQSLELIARDPAGAQQLNQIIAQVVCNDAATFEEVGKFVAVCLTWGKAAKIPDAIAQFSRMATTVSTN